MLDLLRQVERKRRTYRRKLLGRYDTLTTGLFALAGLLFFAGIVDWPNIPFAIGTAALGALCIFSVLFAPLGLLFL